MAESAEERVARIEAELVAMLKAMRDNAWRAS
jgi:hypothetical protein